MQIVARTLRFIVIAVLVVIAAALFAFGVDSLQFIPEAVPEPSNPNFQVASLMFICAGTVMYFVFEKVFNN